ncbi:ankyrin repeat domain-containing protein 11-like [Gigantopelta aegis]|uniref:ankyrin repeat domain-containing protein 11-like n=1 Tax=Gigantopelta aegis TaxID=1735272 RepID=UPI001B88D567|nr:ankyrin repeat domain-containing protein 11-like [Gigantopelta aegis]
MPGLRYKILCMPDMSEKKSPPRKEKPQYVKTPQSESKGMKRKLIITESVQEDDDKRITPKRKRGLTLDSSPEPPAPRTPGSISRMTMPLSERQQMALLMRMTDDNSQGDASPKALSSPPPMSSAKKTPGDKKVNKRNDRGETSLHMAAKRGDIKQTKKLIKAGANVNVKDYAGWTPLHEACNRGMLSVAKQLMKAGANVNVQGFENDTPLHDASVNGHQKLVELLLKHGANPLQLNLKGKTPVDVAASPDLEIVLRKEIISSSSDSSSMDDARSPTSPESMSSVKDEDSRTGDEDVHPHSSLKSDTSSSSRRVLIPQSPEKTTSPLLCIKFDADKGQPPVHKVLDKPLVKPYDLTVLTDEPVKNSSRHGSPVSSISDSELYDPHLDSSYVSREPTLDEQLSSSSWLYGKERHMDSEMVSGSEKEQKHELKAQQTMPFTPHLYDSMGGGENSKPLHVSVRNSCSSSVDGGLQIQQLQQQQPQPQHIPMDLNSSSVGNGTLLPSSGYDGVSQYPVTTCTNSGSVSGSYASTAPHGVRTRTQNSHKGVNIVTTSEAGDSSSLSSSSSGIPLFSHKNSQKHDDGHYDIFNRLGDQLTAGQDGRFLPRSFSPKTKSNQDNKESSPSPKNHSRPVSPRIRSERTVSPNSMECDSCVQSPKTKVENESKEIYSASPKVRLEKDGRDGWPASPRTRSDSNISRSASPKTQLDKEIRSSSPKTRSESRSSSPRLKAERESRPVSPRFKMDREHPDSRSVSPRLRSDQPVSPRLRSDWPVSPRLRSDRPVSPQLRSDQPVSPRLRLDREAKDSRPVSPRLRSDSRPVSPRLKDSRDSRPSSPRLMRLDRDSRACSPKVPPLRIILPPKATSTVTKDADCLKLLLNKPALPYVLNPTQDQQGQEQGGEQAENAQTDAAAMAQSVLQADAVVSSEDGKMAEGGAQLMEQEQNKDSSSKEEGGAAGEKEETTGEEKERRVTRTLRSHTAMMQQQQQQQHQQKDQQFAAPQKQEKNNTPDPPNVLAALTVESGITTRSQKADDDDSSVHSQKRKLRPKSDSTSSTVEEPMSLPPPPAMPSHLYEKPPNPFELFLGIRKQIAAKHDGLRQHSIQPKAPNGYKDYLMVTCTYVLQGNTASTLSVPMLSPPNSVTGPMRDLFEEQENLRYKLRLQHLIEREKLVLSIEQEVLREHGRAARALANQSIPFSVCSILNDEDIYNLQEIEQVETRDKNVRSRYNGRQFFSWLQDVEDKYEKIKEFLLSRHHHEAESLYAVQKMDWQWKMKELSLCDSNTTPDVDDLHVPMVHINDEFELLPS